MTYTKQTWVNGKADSGGTPINANRLNYMETGIAAAATTADSVATGGLLDTRYTRPTDVTGIDLTGTVDCSAALQALLNVGDLLLPSGIYRVNTRITYTGLADRTIQAAPGANVTIIAGDINGVFKLRGGFDDLGSVSSYANASSNGNDEGSSAMFSTHLTMASATTVTKGDILKVVSDDYIRGVYAAGSGAGNFKRRGEYSMCLTTSSGTDVSLSNQLFDTYTNTVRLARLWDTRFKVKGIQFVGDLSLMSVTGYGATIELLAAKYCEVSDCLFENIAGRAIANYTFGASIQNCEFRYLSNRPFSYGHYGYGIAEGGTSTRISNCHFENCRHGISENCNDTTAGSSAYEYFGGGHYCVASNCSAVNVQGPAFDTHESSVGFTFNNCKAFGSFIGSSSGGGGFTARGFRTTFSNCEAHDCYTGFQINSYDKCVLNNCSVYGAYSIAMDVTLATPADTTITSQTNVSVNGGVFEAARNSTGTNIIQVTSNTGSFVPSYVDFTDTVFRLIGSGGNGSKAFDVYGIHYIRLTNCTLDLRSWAGGAASMSLLYFRTATSAGHFRSRGLRVLAPDNLGATPVIATGQNASTTVNLRLEDTIYEYNGGGGVDLTFTAGNFTDFRWSFTKQFGTSWFQRLYSSQMSIVAAASVSLAPVIAVLDRHVVCRFSGTNGVVTTAALGTPEYNGMQVTFYNDSNGTVQVSGLGNPIAVGGALTVAYGAGTATWKVVNQQ